MYYDIAFLKEGKDHILISFSDKTFFSGNNSGIVSTIDIRSKKIINWINNQKLKHDDKVYNYENTIYTLLGSCAAFINNGIPAKIAISMLIKCVIALHLSFKCICLPPENI